MVLQPSVKLVDVVDVAAQHRLDGGHECDALLASRLCISDSLPHKLDGDLETL